MNFQSEHSRRFPVQVITRLLQLLILSSGILLLVWSFYDPRFRDGEGFLNAASALNFSAGTALIILGSLVNGRFKKFAFWLVLALVGQAAALQMIEAGPVVRFQHYKPIYRILTETQPLVLIFMACQTVLVAAGLKRIWSELRDWSAGTFKRWQLVCIGLVFLLTSATVSLKIPVYVSELFFAAFIQLINLGNIILMVWAIPEETLNSLKGRLDRVFGHGEEVEGAQRSGIDRFALVAALWVLVFAVTLGFLSYERHPHLQDEVGYLYHARYFAEGMLKMPAPAVQEAFTVDLMTYDGDGWYSPVPPGWPAMLALGAAFGVPWLVNPILAGLNIVLSYLLILELYDRRSARMAVVLLSVSPWYVFMAMNFMTHTFTLTCSLLAAVAVTKARKSGRALWGWVSGFSIGMVSLIRPLEAVVAAVLLGLWSMGVGGRRLKGSALVGLAVGTIVVGSLGLYYNNLLTGDPAKFPLMAYFDMHYGPGTNALGFGPERGFGWAIDPFPGHGLLDALININLNAFSTNIELFGWSTGSLVLIAVIVFSRTMQRADYLMLSIIGAVVGIHTLYWFSGGPDFGARYWFLIIIPCAVLTVRGIRFISERLDRTRGARVTAGVLVLCLLTLVNYFPWRAIDKYHHYLGMRPDIRRLAKQYNFGRSLVLVRGSQHPDYHSAAIYNPVDLRADVPIYAWDRNRQVRLSVLSAYQDRPVWIVDGPSITKGAYNVVDGPIPAYELVKKEEEGSSSIHSIYSEVAKNPRYE